MLAPDVRYPEASSAVGETCPRGSEGGSPAFGVAVLSIQQDKYAGRLLLRETENSQYSQYAIVIASDGTKPISSFQDVRKIFMNCCLSFGSPNVGV